MGLNETLCRQILRETRPEAGLLDALRRRCLGPRGFEV